MVLPLLAAVTIALCGVVVLARDAVLAQGAAREGARAVAVGGDRSLAATAARQALPARRKATVLVSHPAADLVRVQVRVWIALPYGAAVPVAADAVAAVEPGTVSRSGGGTGGGTSGRTSNGTTSSPRPS